MDGSYQNAYYGVMIGILVVVGHALYDTQEIEDESVVHGHCVGSVVRTDILLLRRGRHTKVFPLQALDARGLVQQLEQHLVQPGVLVHAGQLHQVDQAREDALLVHHLEGGIVLVVAAVEEQEGGDHVQRGVIVVLQQAVYDLAPDILLVGREQLALEQAVDAFGEAVLGLQVLGWGQSRQWRARQRYRTGGAYPGSWW
jgi:hypothetical protein